MNITLFTDLRFTGSSTPTGVGKHIVHMATGLASMPGWSVRIAACADQFDFLISPAERNHLSSYQTCRLPLSWKLAQALWTLVGGPSADKYCEDADWVYCPKNDFIPLRRIRSAVTIHGAQELDPQMPRPLTISATLNRLRRRLSYRRILHQAALVLTVSDFLKKQIVEWFGLDAEDVVVVGNGVEECYYRAATIPLDDGEDFAHPFILCVGGLNYLDGGDRILQLASDLRRQGAGIEIVVAGWQHNPRLVAAANALGNVRLLGYVVAERLAAIMLRAKLLFYPTRYETFGIAAAEAMAAGLPVLTGRVTAVPEICGEAAMYVDLTAPQTVFDRVLQMTASESTRSHYAQLGRERSAMFSWNASVERLARALTERSN